MTPHTRRAALLICATLTLTGCLAGCGVPVENTPRTLNATASPSAPIPPTVATTSTPATARERLYLVDDGVLTAVERNVDQPPTASSALRTLLAGPSDTEQAAGLTSALLGTDVVGDVRMDGGIATVELTANPDDSTRTDEVLAFAQLVCTLTALPEVAGVEFTRDGNLIGVPRADGSLARAPLTAADYAALLASPSPSAAPTTPHN